MSQKVEFDKHVKKVLKEKDKLQSKVDSLLSDFENQYNVKVLTHKIERKLVIGVFIDAESPLPLSSFD
ncbi:hypothetical protein GYB57_05315 [bacterium]|nr:hypothetical protein [bacterium]